MFFLSVKIDQADANKQQRSMSQTNFNHGIIANKELKMKEKSVISVMSLDLAVLPDQFVN